jgi:hypothetical protein
MRIGRQGGQPSVDSAAKLERLDKQLDSLKNEWLASHVRENKLRDDTARYLAKARSYEKLATDRELSTTQLKRKHGKEMQKLIDQVNRFTDAGLDSFYRARYVWPGEADSTETRNKNGIDARYSLASSSGGYFKTRTDSSGAGQYDIRSALSDSTEGFGPEGIQYDVNRGSVPGISPVGGKPSRTGEDIRMEVGRAEIQTPAKLVSHWRCSRSGVGGVKKIELSDLSLFEVFEQGVTEDSGPPGGRSTLLTSNHLVVPEVQGGFVMGADFLSIWEAH